MIISRLWPSRCNAPSEHLRRTAELHALSSLAVGSEARKVERRLDDIRTTADATERRQQARLDTLNRLLERDR